MKNQKKDKKKEDKICPLSHMSNKRMLRQLLNHCACMIESVFYIIDPICSVRVHASKIIEVIPISVNPFPIVCQNCAVAVCISPEAIFAVADPNPALLICKISISVKCVGISVRSGVSGIIDHVAIIDVVPVIVFPKPSVISGTVGISV